MTADRCPCCDWNFLGRAPSGHGQRCLPVRFTADGIPEPPPRVVTNRDLGLGDDQERTVVTFLRDLRGEAEGTVCAGLEPCHRPEVPDHEHERLFGRVLKPHERGPLFGFEVPGRGPLVVRAIGPLTLDQARAVVHACAIVLETTPGWASVRP